MKKALILLLSALLLITSLAGCGAVEEQEPEAEAAEYDWDAAYAKFSPDTVVMSINGSEVHWDEYFYWMYREYASYAAGYDLSDGVPGYEDTLIGEYIAAAAADFSSRTRARSASVWAISGGSAILWTRVRAPASSSTSMALSGRKRSCT